MKTFEEKWTAWVDGELTGADLAEFERTLPDRAAALAEKASTEKLGAFLKEQLQAPRAMGNEEFFHHQLLTRIRSEMETERGARDVAVPDLRATWWSIRRLLWVGATSLALFMLCTVFVWKEKRIAEPSPYFSQILQARVDPSINPHASVTIFQTSEDKVTVLWVDGLQSLPSEYATR